MRLVDTWPPYSVINRAVVKNLLESESVPAAGVDLRECSPDGTFSNPPCV